MVKFEAKFQTLFNHWLKSVYMPKNKGGGFAFELKHTHNKPFLPFNAVEEHQINALVAVNSLDNALIYKIPDDSRSYKPFDCFAMKDCQAYIVIKYKTFFVLIDINTFILEKGVSKFKNLTENRAKEIAKLVVHLH